MLISPAEPAKLKELGQVSAIPEKRGCDFLFVTHGMWVGIQRKEINDLIASVMDGRLYKEVLQMQACDQRVLIVEGKPQWSEDGQMLKNFGQGLTLKQWRGLLWSVRLKGIWVEWTEGQADTAQTLLWLKEWFSREKHSSLERRPGPVPVWGSVTNEDYCKHLVMGLPGVGPELAGRIVSRYGGVHWTWKVGVEDLMQIEGVGKVKAEAIYKALGGEC